MMSTIRVLGVAVFGFVAVLYFYSVLTDGGNGPEDSDLVSQVVRDAAYYVNPADIAYKISMDSFASIQGGKPMYLAAKEIREQASIIDQSVANLASLVVNDCKLIVNPAARKQACDGVNSLYAINKVRHGFLVELSNALNQGSIELMSAAAEKYEGDLANLDNVAMAAMINLAAAKQTVGLPMALTEFQ